MNNGFVTDREFREWQAAVAMQYGIEPAQIEQRTETATKTTEKKKVVNDRRKSSIAK